MHTELRFINLSKSRNPPTVVLFQSNQIEISGERPLAWQVIRKCGPGMSHPLIYDWDVLLGIGDGFGNLTQALPASPGQAFRVEKNPGGLRLTLAGKSGHAADLTVRNALPQGAVSAQLYRSGKPVARQTGVVPEQSAAFRLPPTVCVFAVNYPRIEEDQFLDSEILDQNIAELSLLGIARAHLVMTGGGIGPDAGPFRFSLQNAVMA